MRKRASLFSPSVGSNGIKMFSSPSLSFLLFTYYYPQTIYSHIFPPLAIPYLYLPPAWPLPRHQPVYDLLPPTPFYSLAPLPLILFPADESVPYVSPVISLSFSRGPSSALFLSARGVTDVSSVCQSICQNKPSSRLYSSSPLLF